MVFEYFLHLDTHSLIKVHRVTGVITNQFPKYIICLLDSLQCYRKILLSEGMLCKSEELFKEMTGLSALASKDVKTSNYHPRATATTNFIWHQFSMMRDAFRKAYIQLITHSNNIQHWHSWTQIGAHSKLSKRRQYSVNYMQMSTNINQSF